MLVRAGVGVDDMIRGLESLIRARIPKRATGFLQCRNDLFSAPGSGGADHMARAGGTEDLGTERLVKINVSLRITLDRNEGQVQRGIGIDLVNGPQCACPAGPGNQRVTTCARKQQSDFYLTSHGEPSK